MRNLPSSAGFYTFMATGDLRCAIRSLLRDRSFTLAAIAALGLGVGAGTAVFSVVDRILFRSLPYRQADRLVSFGITAPIVPQEFMLSYDYFDWRESGGPFESMGAWVAGVQDCDLNETKPLRLQCAKVDSSLLRTLGIELVAGHDFTRAEEKPNAPRTALISYGLWQLRFGKDPGAVGRTMRLDGQQVTIVGILPADFELPTLEKTDILIPDILDEPEQHARRAAIVMDAVGRLKPGIGPAQAAAALEPLFQRSLEAVTPSFRKDFKLRVRYLRDRQLQDARRASWVLLGAVFAVLLIACANVANLLLARAAAREREVALRAALGAGRWRLVSQSLTESTLVALAGGAAGCALAYALLRVFIAIAPEGIPHLPQAGLDPRVLSFALLLSLVSGVLIGLASSWQRPRMETLGAGRSVGPRRHLFRQCLVAAQICVSLILLASAGLMLRSLWNLENQPLGIRPCGVVTAAVTLGRASYPTPTEKLAFFDNLEQQLRRVPGVSEVALADSLPPSGNAMGAMLYATLDVRGRPRITDGTGGLVVSRSVTPRYFSALGIPILQGRVFQEEDRIPEGNAVILSDRLARRMFPGGNPLGQQLRLGRISDWMTVVGVAANVKNSGLAESDGPEFYLVRKHVPGNMRAGATVIIRTGMPPQAIAEWVRASIASLDATLPVTVETMDQRVAKLAARPRFNAFLLSIFAGLGLLLAAIGLYGVISFLVAQRSQEIGVRMALGASPGAIARLVLRQTGTWIACGMGLGAVGSWFAVRLLEHMLFRVPGKDPWTFAGTAMILAGVALAAAWIPSRRAAHLDPMKVLRRE